MQELQDRVQGAQWFTKLDLKNGFHLLRFKEGDEWKTAFRTRYGLFEFQVIPFGLTNAPSTFQDMMNHFLSDALDIGLLAYMDDILIYAKTEEEHDRLVKEVLERLQTHGLAVSPEKCVWKTQEVEFLGYVIGRNGIAMSQEKVEAVLSWEEPKSLSKTQSFLGFTNFYRRFIEDYLRVGQPLTELTKKTEKWSWNPEPGKAFNELKKRFTMAPIQAHFDAQPYDTRHRSSSRWRTGKDWFLHGIPISRWPVAGGPAYDRLYLIWVDREVGAFCISENCSDHG